MKRQAAALAVALCVAPGRGPEARAHARVDARRTTRALLDNGHRALEAAAYAEAETALRAALALAERDLGPCDLDAARALNQLGMVARYTARFDDAATDYRRALAMAEQGGDGMLLADLHHNLGGLAHARGDFAAGEPFARRAVEIRARLLGPGHPVVAADRVALAALLDGQHRYSESLPLYESAIATLERASGAPPIDLAVALNNLAAAHDALGRRGQAEPLYRRALALKERLLGPDHPDVAATLNNLAVLCRKEGRLSEAAALYARALPIFTRALGADHPKTRIGRANYARLREEIKTRTRRT